MSNGIQEITPVTYPDSRELNRERKVINRKDKEQVRRGDKIERKEEVTVNVINNELMNKIICGDSKDVMKKIPDESIDIIITSPPYNFGLDGYDTHKDTKYWSDYFIYLNDIWKECFRVLKHGGRMCVNIQPLFSDYVPTHHIISDQLLKLGLLFKAEILWDKHNYNCKFTAWGSWKSPSMPYVKYTWEFIEVFCKGTQKKAGKKENIDISGDEFKDWVYVKWDIAPERNMKNYNHPAMFPEAIPYRLIKLFSYQGDIVLDPFNGAGTTTAVARKNNRNYIGIDVSKEYCKRAEQRIKEILL